MDEGNEYNPFLRVNATKRISLWGDQLRTCVAFFPHYSTRMFPSVYAPTEYTGKDASSLQMMDDHSIAFLRFHDTVWMFIIVKTLLDHTAS